MATRVSLAEIAGIAIGGGALICLCGMLLIFLKLRTKHRRKLARITTAGERRLSRFPSSNMSITDDDVARMPGTRATVRRSLQSSFSRSPYTPMSSRNTHEHRPDFKNLDRVRESNGVNREAVIPLPSRHLPRRLTRSDGTPLANVQSSSLVPITERTRNASNKPTAANHTRERSGLLPEDSVQRASSLDIIQNRTGNDVSPTRGLKPKPLFHGRQRSISQDTISQSKERNNIGIQSVEKSHHPRSASVCSREPGLAPTELLPPLPFEVASARRQGVKSPTDFSACESLFSDNTSILDDEGSKAFSQAGTDFTSIGLSSPLVSSPFSESTKIGLDLWNTVELQEKASALSAARTLQRRPQLNSQQSCRTSIEDSLPRSTSSGLSMSLLDHASRAASSTDLIKERSPAKSKSNLAWLQRSAEKKKSKRGTSPSSPLRNGTSVNIHEDVESKRASISVLQTISGNEGSPASDTRNRRPSSIATDNPFLWDHSIKSIPPAKLADRENGHRRQHYVRISNIPLFVPSPQQPRIEEREEHTQESAEQDDTVIKAESKSPGFRPPSRLIFDPQIPSTLQNQDSNPIQTPPYSPTLAMFDFYDSSNNSPESAISTPTKKPPRRAPSSTHPNRLKSIFDNIPPTNAHSHTNSTTSWPLPRTTSPSKPPHIFQLPPASHQNSPESRPASYLFDNFPSPPRRLNLPNWRGPKTPIRTIQGPRAPPWGLHRTNSKTTSRSPSRRRSSRSPSKLSSPSKRLSQTSSPSKRISKTYSNSSPTASDLRRSIMALRRQNSEVNQGGWARTSREHKRYLSIGDGEVFDGREGKENEGMRGSRGSVGVFDEVGTPGMEGRGFGVAVGVGVGTPSSFYEGDGIF